MVWSGSRVSGSRGLWAVLNQKTWGLSLTRNPFRAAEPEDSEPLRHCVPGHNLVESFGDGFSMVTSRDPWFPKYRKGGGKLTLVEMVPLHPGFLLLGRGLWDLRPSF